MNASESPSRDRIVVAGRDEDQYRLEIDRRRRPDSRAGWSDHLRPGLVLGGRLRRSAIIYDVQISVPINALSARTARWRGMCSTNAPDSGPILLPQTTWAYSTPFASVSAPVMRRPDARPPVATGSTRRCSRRRRRRTRFDRRSRSPECCRHADADRRAHLGARLENPVQTAGVRERTWFPSLLPTNRRLPATDSWPTSLTERREADAHLCVELRHGVGAEPGALTG